MSEYQYYGFQAIDRRLTEREMEELRELSSRAEITPTLFTNVYHYGDFRGDENKVMEKYFDIFVYVANWGSRRLMLRFPKSLFDPKVVKPYKLEDSVQVWTKANHVLLELSIHAEDEGGWEDGEGWLDKLLPLRADLMRGDLRSLYIAWLSGVHNLWLEEGEDGPVEPPVPPGMKKLSKPLRSLASFLFLDEDILTAAGRASTGETPSGPSPGEVKSWLATLPETEKTDLLWQAFQQEVSPFAMDLLHRFREGQEPQTQPAADQPGRTVRQLKKAQEDAEEERKKEEAGKKAAARKKHLQQVAVREGEIWQEIDQHIQTQKPKGYDEAVRLLRDLVDLGQSQGREEEIANRVRKLRVQFSRKGALMRRFNEKNLPK